MLNLQKTTYEVCEAGGRFKKLKEVEREHIETVLNYFHGNITQTCRALGMGRTTLYRRLKKYGLKGVEDGQLQA